MKQENRCAHCGCLYPPNPRVKNQRYCNRPECQRARKSKWQREKMENDPDYRKNQKESQACWRARHPDYWKQYRRNHKQYCDRNRAYQKNRDIKRRACRLAKMDALNDQNIIKTGSYYLIPVLSDLAKMDASAQKIYLIAQGYISSGASCKKGLDRQLSAF